MNNFFKKLGLGLGAAAFMGSVAHEAKEDLADQEAHNPFIAENSQETSN